MPFSLRLQVRLGAVYVLCRSRGVWRIGQLKPMAYIFSVKSEARLSFEGEES